jgi:hypothetical protein
MAAEIKLQKFNPVFTSLGDLIVSLLAYPVQLTNATRRRMRPRDIGLTHCAKLGLGSSSGMVSKPLWAAWSVL